jgi:hypothetical protein
MVSAYTFQLLFIGGRARRLTLLALSVLGIAVVYVLYTCNPARSAFYPPCPFHALTGLYCPGCGSLRALHQLLHGHLAVAFGLNPLAIVSLPFLGYSFLSYCIARRQRQLFPSFFVPAPLIWIYLGSVLFFWVIRNISFYPFSLLAP